MGIFDIFKKKVPQLGEPLITQEEADAGATGEIVDTSVYYTGGGGGTSSLAGVPSVDVKTELGITTTPPPTISSVGGVPIEQTAEGKAIIESEKIRREAEARGKGFTRLEVERRLQVATGGAHGTGVTALRRGTRQGLRIQRETPVEFEQRQFEQRQGSASDLLFGGDIQPVKQRGFFQRVKQRGQEEYEILDTSQRGLSGTYRGTGLKPSPYGSYGRAFFQEVGETNIGQDIKSFFKPQISQVKIAGGVVGMGTGAIRETKAYTEFHQPRVEAVTSSKEFNVLMKSAMAGVAFSPAGIGRQVYVETIPLRQRKPAIAREYIETYVVGGKPYRVSDYTITTEKYAPRITRKTSLLRQQLGKDQEFTYLPSVTTRTRTPFKATTQDSFIVLETKGGKVGSLIEVSGVSQEISRAEILSYQKLTSPKKLLVQRLAESKASSPVNEKFIGKFLTDKNQRYFSQIDLNVLGKTRLTNQGIKLEFLKGRIVKKVREPFTLYRQARYSTPQKTTRFEAITEIKLIKEDELFELYESKVLFKDVTYPYARATGKTPELKVITLEKKELNILDDVKDVNIIRPSDIKDLKKTPFSKTYQVQELKQPTLFVPPKIPKARTITKVISPPISSTAKTFQTSQFYGKGLYERTEGGLVPSVQIQPSISKSFIKPREIQISYPKSISFEKELSKGASKEISKEITKEMTKPMSKETTKEITKEIQKPMSKLISKQAQKTIIKPATFPITKPLRVRPPVKPPIIPPKLKPAKQKRGRLGKYDVFGRRFGKFKLIGTAKDPLGAKGIGKRWARQTLGVTFKIPKYKGTKVEGFKTKKKKGEVLFIEPRGKRLKRGTKEIPELQYWKKVKGGIK